MKTGEKDFYWNIHLKTEVQIHRIPIAIAFQEKLLQGLLSSRPCFPF